MITLAEVSKGYFGQARVLDQINLQLKKGDFLFVVGGSGAGKSSLLKLLATEDAPTSGTVSLFGYHLSAVSPSALRMIRQSIGYIPQNTRLVSDLTVYDNIAMSWSLAGRRAQGSAAELPRMIGELLERLGLADKRDKLAGSLSGGEAQRVAAARAMIRSPEVIIADEPTGSQDKEHTWAMMDLFLKANAAGSTVILATHDHDIVRRIRKPCAILKNGEMRCI